MWPIRDPHTGEPIKTPMGHRRDLIYCNSKSVRATSVKYCRQKSETQLMSSSYYLFQVRQYQVKALLSNQRDQPSHSYAVVEDQRFPRDRRLVPIIACRHSRPVVVDDWNYRTTAYAAMSVTWLQAFKQMRRQPLPKISEDEAWDSWLTRDCFSHAVGTGYIAPASMLGLSGTGGFQAPMRMERRDLLITAAEKSGDFAYAEYNIDLYEADEPEDVTENELRRIRFSHQKQIATFNERRLEGKLMF